ncbi:MAG: BBE domain-containing protein [Promethearchaeota archaeon]|jgi:hypothetical protein
MLGIEANWIKPEEVQKNIGWVRDTWDDVDQFSKGGLYLNCVGFEEDHEKLLRDSYGENYNRLIEIKKKYDPQTKF